MGKRYRSMPAAEIRIHEGGVITYDIHQSLRFEEGPIGLKEELYSRANAKYEPDDDKRFNLVSKYNPGSISFSRNSVSEIKDCNFEELLLLYYSKKSNIAKQDSHKHSYA
jgi:hypothetical protein